MKPIKVTIHVLLLLLVLPFCVLSAEIDEPIAKPNVVVILADDMR